MLATWPGETRRAAERRRLPLEVFELELSLLGRRGGIVRPLARCRDLRCPAGCSILLGGHGCRPPDDGDGHGQREGVDATSAAR